MIHHSRHDFIELLSVYICAVIAIFVLSAISVPEPKISVGVVVSEKNKEAMTEYNKETFKNISVQAKAYIIYDLVGRKIIVSKNAETPLPIASITKIMMAITALTHHNRSTKITINKSSLDEGYDLGLKEKQVWKLDELLKYTLVFSSNDGAQAIADGLKGRDQFVADMNTDALLLGLQLKFTQPAGLDINGKFGGEGSALEVAKLLGIARKQFPEILDATTKARTTVTASTGKIIGIPNTNQDITNFVSAEASKTGFTNNAGGNLAVIVDVTLGHPVVIVVLGSTYDGRFADMNILYHTLLKSLVK